MSFFFAYSTPAKLSLLFSSIKLNIHILIWYSPGATYYLFILLLS